MIERAVILAIANRMHHSKLTTSRTHAMLPALGKPLIARIMYRLYQAGIRNYTLVVGETEGAVASYLNTNWVPDAKIEFVLRFGNDSLLKLLRQIALKYDSPFLICDYNCFTHTNFAESLINRHLEAPQHLIFAATRNNLSNITRQYHAVLEDDRLLGIVQQSTNGSRDLTLVNFAVCGSDVLQYLISLPEQQPGAYGWQFMDIAQQYVRAGHSGLVAETSWALQVDTDKDLLTLNRHLLDEHTDGHILSDLPYTVQIIPPVRIDPQVSVGQGAVLGPHVYLARGCNVGTEAVLRNVIVLEKATVPSNEVVTDAIISHRGIIR